MRTKGPEDNKVVLTTKVQTQGGDLDLKGLNTKEVWTAKVQTHTKGRSEPKEGPNPHKREVWENKEAQRTGRSWTIRSRRRRSSNNKDQARAVGPTEQVVGPTWGGPKDTGWSKGTPQKGRLRDRGSKRHTTGRS